MSIRSGIAHVFDRPGGRTLLAAAATRLARRHSRQKVDVFFDRFWMHRSGGLVFPDGPTFRYYREEFRRWADEPRKCAAAVCDYWYHVGTPVAGETVIDVGAGRGEDVLPFSTTVGPTGRVVAIEAHPVTFQLLAEFRRRNRLDNVRTVHAAALDHEGTAMIGDGEDWQENSIGDGGGYRVPARTLDAVCAEFAPGPIGLLKINIEGSETAALRGGSSVLSRTRLVAVACHDFRADRGDGERFRTRSDVLAILKAFGFEISDRREDARPGIQDHVFGVRR